MLRKSFIATALVLTLSLAALGARFTDSYDTVETTIQNLQDGLPDTLDKAQKKAAKTYSSTLKKLGKDTDSLQKEIKLGKSLIGKLSKLGDEQVDGALGSAADAVASDVLAALAAAQQKLDAAAAKITPEKVQKQIDAGYDAMESAATQESLKTRFALYAKAEARARKADKLADKVTGGGGGGGNCDGTPIGESDTVTITQNGADFGAVKYDISTFANDFTTGTQVTFNNCAGDIQLVLTFPDPLTVGSYNGGSLNPESRMSFFCGPISPGFGISNFSGEATVTSVEGRLQLTFSWETGSNESRFDGPFSGTIDIPAAQ